MCLIAPPGVELVSDHVSHDTAAEAENGRHRRRINRMLLRVARPTTCAIVERTLQTMKRECAWRRTSSTGPLAKFPWKPVPDRSTGSAPTKRWRGSRNTRPALRRWRPAPCGRRQDRDDRRPCPNPAKPHLETGYLPSRPSPSEPGTGRRAARATRRRAQRRWTRSRKARQRTPSGGRTGTGPAHREQ